MARPGPAPKPPRIKEWRGQWYLYFHDPMTGKEKRISCAANGATNAETRKEMLDAKVSELAEVAGEMRRRGGVLAYDRILTDAVAEFIADVDAREALREANPSSREGLSKAAATDLREACKHFRDWLASSHRPRIATGEVDAQLLRRYFHFVATEKTRLGNREVIRAGATVNKYRRQLRACFRWLNMLRPPLFPDFDMLATAFKAVGHSADKAQAFAPADLAAFFRAALDYESPSRTVEIHRHRRRVVLPSGKELPGGDETFEQPACSTAATPVSRLFLLLALTGCRLGEALALRWDDVDLARGRLTIRASKTGRTRILPLIGAPEGTVSPTLVSLLRRWKLEAGKREFVLPHGELDAPIFSKSPWQTANTLAGIDRIGPQMLRRNFVSYAASLGIPATVAAIWSGHSAAVAERWYRQQVLDRHNGDSIESAMMGDAVARMIDNANGDTNAIAE